MGVDQLMLRDFDRANAIGMFWGHPETQSFRELLIDLEEDRAARAVISGLAPRNGTRLVAPGPCMDA
jgi:hypothetical protein